MLSKITKMPLALTGLALGVSGIFNAWTLITLNKLFAYLGAIIASILIFIIILKILFSKDQFHSDLQNPLLGSTIPTLDMSMMVISNSLVQFTYLLGVSLWLFAIILHVIYLFLFVFYRFKNKDFGSMLPSWFVPPVGIVVASVSGAFMNMVTVSQTISYIGIVLYIIILPFMFYKLIFKNNIEDDRLPTFAIMGAPANLCLAGYLTAFKSPDHKIAVFLLALGIFTTCLVYISFFRVYKLKFSPLFASYTFPLAIGSQALIKYYAYSNTFNSIYSYIWKSIAIIEIVIASIVIFFVFINMCIFVCKNILFENI